MTSNLETLFDVAGLPSRLIRYLTLYELVGLLTISRSIAVSVIKTRIRMIPFPTIETDSIRINDACVVKMMACVKCRRVGDEPCIRAELLRMGKEIVYNNRRFSSLAALRREYNVKWTTVSAFLGNMRDVVARRKAHLRTILMAHTTLCHPTLNSVVSELNLRELYSIAFREPYEGSYPKNHGKNLLQSRAWRLGRRIKPCHRQ